ncbi:MAG: hypothetical protein ABIP01_02070 [Candidatus Limnocylindria bacterium]
MRIPAGRAMLACLAVAGALALAWLVPTVAPVIVWPLFGFMPGWGLLAVLRPRIDGAGRLGLAIVISVAGSTHLVYWLSHLAGGYDRGVIFAAAALLALPIPWAAWRGLTPPSPLRASRPALLVAGLAAAVVGGTLGLGIWRVTPDGVTSGGSNWSDLGVHLSIAETLNAGANFPPEVPYFAGVPLTYHWFADFHAAILAEAAGIFSVPAMVIQSAILAGALALIVYSLARRLMRGPHARRVALITAGLAVLGGGMGYLRFIGDVTAGIGSPLDLVSRNSYDNQWLTGWPYFRIPSVMGTGLLAHRATTAGLPILIGSVLLLVTALPSARQRLAGWRDRPWLIGLAGVMGALLAPFHFFFFPVFPLLALAWVVAGGRLLDRDAPRNALLLLAPYVLAVPFVIAPALQAGGSGALQMVSLWPSAPRDDGPVAVGFFYLTNLGVPFGLALAALLVPGVPRRAFLAAWLIGLFLVPNVVQLSVIDFDMNKYFQAMWIAVAMLAAWLIHRWPAAAIVAVFALSIPSPLLVAGWTATSNLQVLSRADLDAARWVSLNTPAGAVFVTDGWVNSLTDAGGRKRLTTFGPYVANLGYRPDERISDVLTIYCGGDATLSAELMRRYGSSFLVDGARPQPCTAPVDYSTSSEFELVYDAGPLIWRLTGP